jgi:hypothetical protein
MDGRGINTSEVLPAQGHGIPLTAPAFAVTENPRFLTSAEIFGPDLFYLIAIEDQSSDFCMEKDSCPVFFGIFSIF